MPAHELTRFDSDCPLLHSVQRLALLLEGYEFSATEREWAGLTRELEDRLRVVLLRLALLLEEG